MSVKFKAVERVNPRDLSLPRKYYAQVINGAEVDFDDLADLISKLSSLNFGEVMGALGALVEIIIIQLKEGNPVNLGSLGTFYLTMRSEGVASPEELSSNNIKSAVIQFRPAKRLKKMLETLDFEKVSTPSASPPGEDTSD